MPKGMLGDNLVLRSFLNGPHRDLLEKLNDEEGEDWLRAFKRFLRKENPWPEERKLLGNPTKVDVSLPAKFAPGKYFKGGLNEPVSLREVSPKIERSFSTEHSFGAGYVTLSYRKLLYATRGTPLLKQLDSAQPVPLGAIWEILKGQPQCESGILHTNHNYNFAENIFLVEDDGGKRWFLTVWAVENHGFWDIYLKPTSYSTDRFRKGSLVFCS